MGWLSTLGFDLTASQSVSQNALWPWAVTLFFSVSPSPLVVLQTSRQEKS